MISGHGRSVLVLGLGQGLCVLLLLLLVVVVLVVVGALLLRLALKQTPYQLLSLLLAVGCWLLAFCLRRAINCCC